MRSMQRDQRAALATFHDTYDLRRTMWQEHQRKLRAARERQSVRQQQHETMSSSLAELMTPSTPECDSIGCMGVSHA